MQSQKGHYFVGPAGEKYMNRGRVQLRSMDESSRNCLTKFHIADGVDQALGSVAEMNDSGNMVLFDGEGSAMIPGKRTEAAASRKAMRKCRARKDIHRRKNSLYIPLWVQPEAGTCNKQGQTLFQGRGNEE